MKVEEEEEEEPGEGLKKGGVKEVIPATID